MGNILVCMCNPIHMFMQAFKGKDFEGLRCHETYMGGLTSLKWLISNFQNQEIPNDDLGRKFLHAVIRKI